MQVTRSQGHKVTASGHKDTRSQASGHKDTRSQASQFTMLWPGHKSSMGGFVIAFKLARKCLRVTTERALIGQSLVTWSQVFVTLVTGRLWPSDLVTTRRCELTFVTLDHSCDLVTMHCELGFRVDIYGQFESLATLKMKEMNCLWCNLLDISISSAKN